MKKIILVIGMLFALIFEIKAQMSKRAANVPLNLDRTSVYDSLFYANDWRKIASAEAYNVYKFSYDSVYGLGWMNKMLKIGDQVPNLELGKLMHDSIKETKFSDFKGRIIILDFWSTSCASCIAGFPKMAQLQEKFGDRIQIILVNTSETKEEIVERMGKNITKLPSLPCIVDAKHLWPYFPMRWAPYHVWIDQNGVVRVMGSSRNTYEEKIERLLQGLEIFSWQDECTRPEVDAKMPYAKIVGVNVDGSKYNSFFTYYNKDYAPKGDSFGGRAENVINSLNRTKRNTYINWSIQNLYLKAFEFAISANASERKNYIVNPYFNALYDVKDSLRYFGGLHLGYQADTGYVKYRFCYEQVFPQSISNNQAQLMMAEDLNKYFGKLFGTYGRMEKRTLSSYVIVKLPGEKYRKLFSKSEEYLEKVSVKNRSIYYQATCLNRLFDGRITQQLLASKKMLINETGIEGEKHIDIELPTEATLSNIKQALKPYGLDIIKRNTEVELLVISDIKAK